MVIDTQLPKLVNPIKLSVSGQVLSGKLPLSGMKRLASDDRVVTLEGDVTFLLAGSVDSNQIKIIDLELTATVPLECQRCLKNMAYHLEHKVRLSPVLHERESELLPPDYEVLECPDSEIALSELLEDEILLHLPIIPMHKEDECSVDIHHWNSAESDINEEHVPNAFKVLGRVPKFSVGAKSNMNEKK